MSAETRSDALEELRAAVVAQHGFLRAEQLADLGALRPSDLVLVRWHEGRALVPAAQAAGLVQAAERGGWTVRDVSLPSNHPWHR